MTAREDKIARIEALHLAIASMLAVRDMLHKSADGSAHILANEYDNAAYELDKLAVEFRLTVDIEGSHTA